MGWRQDHCFIDDLVPLPGAARLPPENIVDQPQLDGRATSTPAPDLFKATIQERRRSLISSEVEGGRIWLAVDLGTAYSKIAYRIEPGPPNLVQIRPGQ